jgi:hypothetical protein
MNVSAKLDKVSDLLKPIPYTAVFDNNLLTIAAAAGDSNAEAKIYDYDTEIKEIEVYPDRYDAGDYYFFVIAGHEVPEKGVPFYSWGYGTTPEKNKHVFEGNLPVCPSKKSIVICWHNAAAQAKKVNVRFKRLVFKG